MYKQMTEKLDLMLSKARKIRKKWNVFYVLKAFVVMGRGWHTIDEVYKKALELSGNPKLKYYPVQDAIKYGFAELDKEQKETRVGLLRVKLKDEIYDIIEREIDRYIQEIEKIA
ncbi:MAG: hypothetical protein QXQ24_01805 [Nitrososphaeria archaeon]